MTGLGPGEGTWTCHVCGDERPDAQISVRQHDRSAAFKLPPGTWLENVRYCNDRSACREGAETFSFTDARSPE